MTDRPLTPAQAAEVKRLYAAAIAIAVEIKHEGSCETCDLMRRDFTIAERAFTAYIDGLTAAEPGGWPRDERDLT